MKLRNFGKKVALGIATVSMLAGAAAFVAPTAIASASAAPIYLDGVPMTGVSSSELPNLKSINVFMGIVGVKEGTKLAKIDGHDDTTLQEYANKKGYAFPVQAIASDGHTDYYQVSTGGDDAAYVSSKSSTLVKLGTAHVNYPAKYGIQIWTRDHKIVKNSNGTAKKLKGQTNWSVYGQLTKIKNNKEDTIYLDLGGDQYIDLNYVTFTPNSTFKAVFTDK